MIRKSQDIASIVFSIRVYQLLLKAYPTKFQQEYGSQMVQVFQDCCLRAFRQNGTSGILRLWGITLLDFLRSVVEQHLQKETDMSKSQFIKLSGWAFILGSFVFLMSILGDSLAASVISSILLVFGVLGLRQRYGEKVGSFGRNILLIGAILGPLTSLIGFFLVRVGRYWFITWTGPAVLFTCLILFGVVALYKRPLPRWNILPIIAGLTYPVIWFTYIVTSLLTGYWERSLGPADSLIINISFTIQFIGLAALGYILKSDVPEDTAAPA